MPAQYTLSGIALRISKVHKSLHHDKVADHEEDPDLTTEILYKFFGRPWDEKRTLADWAEGQYCKAAKKGWPKKVR